MDKEVLSENGCGKLHFLGLKLGSGFEEPGGTPHQEFPGVLVSGPGVWYVGWWNLITSGHFLQVGNNRNISDTF